MSLLVCLLGTDGLVLATDSRGTFGDPRGVTAQNDLIKKLYLANDRVAILVAGAGDLGSTVVSGFLALPQIASFGITDLTLELHRYSRAQFAQWFELFSIKPTANDSRPGRPDLNFLVAGFDVNQGPKIYRMSSSLDFVPMLHNYGFGIDGVAQYALYLMNRLYDPESVMEDLQCLAAYVITETASQDGKVGGLVQMATVTKRDAQILSTSVVENIVLTNRQRSQAWKKSFLKKDYVLHTANSKKAKPTRGSKALSGRAPTPDSVGVSAPPPADALSTVVEETSGAFSTGTVW